MTKSTFEVAQRSAEKKLNRQAARTCSIQNNAQAIIELTNGDITDPQVLEKIYLIACAIQYDAQDQQNGLNDVVNIVADIHQLRISHA
ncbi:hypothetical protein [Pseudoalteromonas rhizosphaerae]|uniref:hypothetical protein n=1 Tax=Pseudoalteromonas rhizosphaerae TaxID=2518973 RepID=UPI00123087F6|nr:hypothetical protein [Pseudoalteromonas rhizosphaerae]